LNASEIETGIEIVTGREEEAERGNDQDLFVDIGPKVIAKWETNAIFLMLDLEELVKRAQFHANIGPQEKAAALEIVVSFFTMVPRVKCQGWTPRRIAEVMAPFVNGLLNASVCTLERNATDERTVMFLLLKAFL